MASVNEGPRFLGDGKENEQGSLNSLKSQKILDIMGTEIDYSAARKTPSFIAAFCATWGAYMLGSLMGWSSPVQPQLQHVKDATVPAHVTDPESVWYMNLDNTQMSLVGSLMNLGAAIGAIMGGVLMEKFGRKLILTIMSLPFAISYLLIALAIDPSMLYIGRIIGGWAGGVCSVVAPSYVGEIAMPHMRGTLGFSFQIMLVLGIVMPGLFGLGLDWRLLSAVFILFTLAFLFCMIYVPESPYYLVKKGKPSEARNAMKWLRGPDYDMEPELAQMEFRVRIELSEKGRFSDIWSQWAWKPVLISTTMFIFVQLSGINAALFNAAAIFESAGSQLDNLVSAVLLNVDQLVATLIASLLIERLGRQTLFLISEIFMCISMVALGTYFYLKEETDTDVSSIGWLPLTSLILFIAAFSIGAGPVPWIMFGEILPAKVKASGSSLASFTNWFLAFVVTLTFVDIQNAIGSSGVFWMFGGFCAIGSFFTFFLLPETKGKSPEQIQAFFGIYSAPRAIDD